MSRHAWFVVVLACACGVCAERPLYAHSGPPFPIVSSQPAGPYKVSIWTDPDTTDDGRAAGQFWVVVEAADGTKAIPPGTSATVSIRPLDRPGPGREGRATPVDGAVARQFVALLMDHEGPFAVHVTIEGGLGRAVVDGQVNATYDLRPASWLLALYLLPFVALGALWGKVLLRRRHRRTAQRTARAAEELRGVVGEQAPPVREVYRDLQ